MTYTLGIDPGLSGAVALGLSTVEGLSIQTYDMPTLILTTAGKQRRKLDLHALGALVRALALSDIALAVVEDLSGRPASFRNGKGEVQAQAGQWALGWNCCAPVMALAAHAVPLEMVRPADWKRRLAVPADKDGARLRASQLMPEFAGQWSRVKDDGRAEAALLALYALRRVRGEIGQ